MDLRVHMVSTNGALVSMYVWVGAHAQNEVKQESTN